MPEEYGPSSQQDELFEKIRKDVVNDPQRYHVAAEWFDREHEQSKSLLTTACSVVRGPRLLEEPRARRQERADRVLLVAWLLTDPDADEPENPVPECLRGLGWKPSVESLNMAAEVLYGESTGVPRPDRFKLRRMTWANCGADWINGVREAWVVAQRLRRADEPDRPASAAVPADEKNRPRAKTAWVSAASIAGPHVLVSAEEILRPVIDVGMETHSTLASLMPIEGQPATSARGKVFPAFGIAEDKLRALSRTMQKQVGSLTEPSARDVCWTAILGEVRAAMVLQLWGIVDDLATWFASIDIIAQDAIPPLPARLLDGLKASLDDLRARLDPPLTRSTASDLLYECRDEGPYRCAELDGCYEDEVSAITRAIMTRFEHAEPGAYRFWIEDRAKLSGLERVKRDRNEDAAGAMVGSPKLMLPMLGGTDDGLTEAERRFLKVRNVADAVIGEVHRLRRELELAGPLPLSVRSKLAETELVEHLIAVAMEGIAQGAPGAAIRASAAVTRAATDVQLSDEASVSQMPAARRSSKKVRTVGAPRRLTELHVEVLEVLSKNNATTRDRRLTGDEIAQKLAGRQKDSGLVKQPLAELSKWHYVASVRGRRGGSWITPKGQERYGRECASK